MRFLHTSDWHLGRTLHGASLLDHQQTMIDTIVELAREGGLDAAIIAGDIFDRAIPPVEAIELWEQAVARLAEVVPRVIAISGNHDSARRVSTHDRLLEASGVSIRGAVGRCAEPIMVQPRNASSPVAIYAIPYLDPVVADNVFNKDAPDEDQPYGPEPDSDNDCGQTQESAEEPPHSDAPSPRRRISHHSVTRAAMARVNSNLHRQNPCRSVVVAHTFVSGGHESDSERNITLGNVENVSPDLFDQIDYVALGHLHGPQDFDGGRIAYSGSPLPYSFSEEHHVKSVRVVELADDGKPSVETVKLGTAMRLVTVTGELDELLSNPSHKHAESAYVRVVLTDRHLPMHAMQRLRTRFAETLEMRHLTGELHRSSSSGPEIDLRRPTRVSPIDVAVAFLDDQERRAVDDQELELLSLAFENALSVQGRS